LDAPDKAKEAGADAFLLKPVKPAKMMQVVEELLSGNRFKEVRYG
jgi:DNA-binding NarL/FixJ family response regulator